MYSDVAVTELKPYNWAFEISYNIWKAAVVLDSNFEVLEVEIGTKGGYWGNLGQDTPFFQTTEFEEYSTFISEVQKQIKIVQRKEMLKNKFKKDLT